jgi:hypothetical protein
MNHIILKATASIFTEDAKFWVKLVKSAGVKLD